MIIPIHYAPNRNRKFLFSILALLLWVVTPFNALAATPSIEKGSLLPNATLIGIGGTSVQIDDLKGRVKILSMVPQLNTPVCDEQTHRFSEQNGGLDKQLDIVTISTNSSNDQAKFSEKANIRNITFLSDSPDFDFGKQTGLLLAQHGILHRAVIVSDAKNVVRYIEIVPMSQLPNFEQAYQAARNVLDSKSQ